MSTDTTDTNILNSIIPRLIKSGDGSILGLEVIDGPYKGVVFSYDKFVVLRDREENGMVPTRFETKIHNSPPDFHPDEAFDLFCSEVLLAWLSYVSLSSDMADFAKMETRGIH